MTNVFSISHQVNNSRPHCHYEAFPIVVTRTEDSIRLIYISVTASGARGLTPGCVQAELHFLKLCIFLVEKMAIVAIMCNVYLSQYDAPLSHHYNTHSDPRTVARTLVNFQENI